MNITLERFRSLVIGFYVWVSTVFFGGILLDIMYSNLSHGVLGTSESTAVFSEVADNLLCIGVIMILAAIGAITFSWNSRIARNLFIASLVILILEFLTPVFFYQFVKNAKELNIGPWLRIIPSGLASVLAFIGLHQYYQQE